MAADEMVGVTALAAMLNLSQAHIGALVKQGVIPKARRNEYPLTASVSAYCRYLQAAVLGKNGSPTKSLSREEEELRKVREQADKFALDNALRRRDQLPAGEVLDFIQEVAVIYGTQLDALAGRLAGQIPGDQAEIRSLIFGESRAIRAATADRLLEYVGRIRREAGQNRELPAGQDGGPVGGLEPAAPEGKRGARAVAE
jgi:DNA-directed RNA polymerase subunit F